MDRERLVTDLRQAGCVFAEDEADTLLASLPTNGDAALNDYVERRRRGEPAEYILGWAELAGVRVAVGPGVFIPRPWSDGLVSRASTLLGEVQRGIVVDLGTGSGAIALAIHARVPGARFWATESDPLAARWADLNFTGRQGLTICVGDLYDALPETLAGSVDLIVGSLPYVPTPELEGLPRDHLVHEPLVAFDGGPAGLTAVSRAVEEAGRWLRRPGHVLLEIGVGHGAAAAAIAAAARLSGVVVHRDTDGGELFLEAAGPPAGPTR